MTNKGWKYKNQFILNQKTDLKKIKAAGHNIVEVYVSHNGYAVWTRNTDTDLYHVFVRTQGFNGDWFLSDPLMSLKDWGAAKRDLDEGRYGPWNRRREQGAC